MLINLLLISLCAMPAYATSVAIELDIDGNVVNYEDSRSNAPQNDKSNFNMSDEEPLYVSNETLYGADSADMEFMATEKTASKQKASTEEEWERIDYTPPDKNDFYGRFLDRNNPRVQFEFGGEGSFIKYEEPGIMQEEGNMYGVFASYTYRLSENQHIHSWDDVLSDTNKFNMFRLDGKFSFGTVDYESVNTGTLDDLDDRMAEGRAVIGYDIPIYRTSRITPYGGFGYRYLYDDLRGTSTTGALGYQRESHYAYLPIGIETEANLSNGWSVILTVEYDYLIDGEQKSHFEDILPSLNTIENDQNDGYGARGSVRIMKKNENIDFFVEPFIRYWDIDDSEISAITFDGTPIGFGLEPENKSTEYGVKLGIRY